MNAIEWIFNEGRIEKLNYSIDNPLSPNTYAEMIWVGSMGRKAVQLHIPKPSSMGDDAGLSDQESNTLLAILPALQSLCI